ncbi:hypothetical protein ABFV57_30855, partial [Pseudomonas neuropathica]|uniref:hypothetical protein n=1 Tax=Pseudomonas neuropathica TaxID=2730425 RepID=UPI0034D5F2AE
DWPPSRYMIRPRREWVAIMQVPIETLTGLHIVDDCDEAPWNTYFVRNALISVVVLIQTFDQRIDDNHAIWSNQKVNEECFIVGT